MKNRGTIFTPSFYVLNLSLVAVIRFDSFGGND